MQVRSSLELEKQCQASCRVDIGVVAFSQGSIGLSNLPLCFESIFDVTVESVQGNQVYLEWTGTSGSFGMVARPLEFLSTFKLRAPPLEVRRDQWGSFPNEAGKETLISR